MSIKQEIETWVAAMEAYDSSDFGNALRHFEQIADTSKILFNVGVINATLGEHTKAVRYYQSAVQLDQYLAVAYFQQGVSNFLMGDFEEALANFNDTLLYLRGNNNIDYDQLGLKFKLYSCEVIFNRGLCYIYLQQKEAGMQDLFAAAREKAVPDHDVIDEAIREHAEGYTVFSIPVGVIYRPNEAKVKNLKTKDYLGRARLVAAQDQQHAGDPRRRAAQAAMAVDDRPEDKLSYAALNLVRPDLRSKSRQQSEPPMYRNIFPPTPPPEQERVDSAHSLTRQKSFDNGSTNSLLIGYQQSRPVKKPRPLDLGAAAFEQQPSQDRPWLPKRSESERPAARREHSSSNAHRREERWRREERMRYAEIPEVQVKEDPIPAVTRHDSIPPSSYTQQCPPHQRSRSTAYPHRAQPLTISEAEEEGSGTSELSDAWEAPLAFEIIPPRPAHDRLRSRSRRAPPDIRRIRVKVHAEDMRYVMAGVEVRFGELAELIRGKFGIAGGFKVKIRDEEGDLVTMSDQEDLDMAISMCTSAAAREHLDVGKMEVWIQEI